MCCGVEAVLMKNWRCVVGETRGKKKGGGLRVGWGKAKGRELYYLYYDSTQYLCVASADICHVLVSRIFRVGRVRIFSQRRVFYYLMLGFDVVE